MFYNPYTEKIQEYSNIWNDEEKICSYKGRWKSLLQKDVLMLEIGTGMGNFFAHYAENNRETGCIGIELKYKRLYRTYEKCAQKKRDDVILLRIMWQQIADVFDTGEVDELYLLFSDPWPKKAHHKHRVVQEEFLQHASKILSKKGFLSIKTDDEEYAIWIQKHLNSSGLFDYQVTVDEDPNKRATPENATEFETIWRNRWKKITAFLCSKR